MLVLCDESVLSVCLFVVRLFYFEFILLTVLFLEYMLGFGSISERKKNSKGFFCKCVRCMAKDDCRLHKCLMSNCNDYISFTSSSKDSPYIWECKSCGPVDEDGIKTIMNKEKNIESKLKTIQTLVVSPGGVSNVHPNMIKKLLREAGKSLLPIHYLVLRVLEEKVLLCASQAAGLQQTIDMVLLPCNFFLVWGQLLSYD